MAQIDLKNTYIYLYDGSDLSSITAIIMTDPNASLTCTPLHMASPAAPITITFVDPGASSSALEVSVSGRDITVSLETDGGSSIISTGDEMKAALDANATVASWISVATSGTGLGTANAKAKITLTTNASNHYVQVKVLDGNLTYDEKRGVESTLDRGTLDSIRNADDEPMDVTLDFMWDYLSSGSSTPPATVEEVLKKLAPADDWFNASTDPCTPHSVNIAIANAQECVGVDDEVIEILEFYYESLNHDLDDGSVSITGRANKTQATAVRVTTALTP